MKDFCFRESNILLPNGVDNEAFACIACDQFTSELNYWKKLENFVGDKRSTLNLIFPEIYLNDNPEKRIVKINDNMKQYLKENVFKELPKGFILTVRKTAYVEKRVGLIGMLDLEEYDYKSGSKTPIRATEGTIESRIPPRLKIRENAELEFPHIMVLIDDEKREIIEEVYKSRNDLEKLYSFNLNMKGGSIEGYFVSDYEKIKTKLNALLDKDRQVKKYGENSGLLFAVGDGNHSLATAKAHWNNVKKTLSSEEIKNHPARFALVEIVNIYDEGIYFEPIHRFISNVDRKNFISKLKDVDMGNVRIYDGETFEKSSGLSLPQGIINTDNFTKSYIEEYGGNVDYVHGDDNVKKLVDGDKTSVAILFNKLDKKDLFKYVVKSGSLPRKTFSMGEGIEKRYYLEGRKIR